jgi:hypothetical protein
MIDSHAVHEGLVDVDVHACAHPQICVCSVIAQKAPLSIQACRQHEAGGLGPVPVQARDLTRVLPLRGASLWARELRAAASVAIPSNSKVSPA